jgi:arginine deiminase
MRPTEHDQFVEVMRARDVEVFYVLDLLSETLQASQEAKCVADRKRLPTGAVLQQ